MINAYRLDVASFEVPQEVLKANDVNRAWKVRETNYVYDPSSDTYRLFVTMERVIG